MNSTIDKRMVAFCDVLGFKALVKGRPLGDIASALTFLRRALGFAAWQEDPGNPPPDLSVIRGRAKVGFAWFSDSLFLYALDDSDQSALLVIEAVGWLLFSTGFSSIVSIRGAIAYGDMLIDPGNDVYVGQPLIDAVQLEARQDWSGATLCDSAVARVAMAVRLEDFVWLRRYPVPMKAARAPSTSGCLARLYDWALRPKAAGDPIGPAAINPVVVDWTFGTHYPTVFQWSPSSIEPTPLDEQKQPDVVRKYRNTKAFHDGVCRWCRE